MHVRVYWKDVIRDKASCPACRTCGKRHSIGSRTIVTLQGRLRIRFGKFYCPKCRVHFSDKRLNTYAPRRGRYGLDVIKEVYRLYDGNATYREICDHLYGFGICMPKSTAHDIIRVRVR